jgi:hypothetical protein
MLFDGQRRFPVRRLGIEADTFRSAIHLITANISCVLRRPVCRIISVGGGAMFFKHCHKKHKPMGLFGLTVVSVALTLPFIYYAMDMAHSLRVLANDSDDLT